jgi:predicted transcriptional regulator YdeE
MKKTAANLAALKLLGITARTNNALEMNPESAKIGITMHKYFSQAMPDKIPNRKAPGTTFCVYTNYESDVNGDYTYFIGEEVTSFDSVDAQLETLIIPAQDYAKFTNEPAPMPAACINMWQNIWQMSASDLGGQRAYVADFEVYDARSIDQQNTVLDIYIGVKK